jgi:hypothetical protein
MLWVMNFGLVPRYRWPATMKVMASMEEQAQRQPNGRFAKGHRRISARVKGTPNRISRDLREGILDAAIAHGADGNGKNGLAGCCDWLLRSHTKAFVPLLVRLLPLQVSGEVVRHTKLHVTIQPIPRGSFYDKAGVLHPPKGRCIEHSVEVAATIDDLTPPAEDPSAMNATPPACDDDRFTHVGNAIVASNDADRFPGTGNTIVAAPPTPLPACNNAGDEPGAA